MTVRAPRPRRPTDQFSLYDSWRLFARPARLLAQGQRVIVDLSDTEFIDSSVLFALVSGDQQARNNGYRLTLQLRTAAIVERALELGGLLDHLPVGATREQAIELAGPPTAAVGKK